MDEARRIATNIAKLPILLGKETWGESPKGLENDAAFGIR